MMGGKTPEACSAVNKRQDNKLENCCIWLVIYLNCTMMHGITNLKETHITSSAQVHEEEKNSEDNTVKQKYTLQIISNIMDRV
jgi:hypothetical protein